MKITKRCFDELVKKIPLEYGDDLRDGTIKIKENGIWILTKRGYIVFDKVI